MAGCDDPSRPQSGEPHDDAASAQAMSLDGEVEPWNIDVLVLEDSDVDYHWMSNLLGNLEEFEARLVRAKTIRDAIALASTREFDVAMVDYHLPDGHGDDFLRALAEGSGRCAPIMISGHTPAEVSLYALRAGAVAALTKDDLTLPSLEMTIRFAIRNQAYRRQAGRLDYKHQA